MKNQQTDWFKIIQHWVLRGGTGYSLPFLVGVRLIKEARTEASIDDAKKILDEIFNPQTQTDTLQLTWCPQLDVPVFGLNRVEINGITIISEQTQLPSVVVRDDIVELWGDSSDQLMSGLLDHSRQPIQEGHLSRVNGSWVPMPEGEQRRIKNILETNK